MSLRETLWLPSIVSSAPFPTELGALGQKLTGGGQRGVYSIVIVATLELPEGVSTRKVKTSVPLGRGVRLKCAPRAAGARQQGGLRRRLEQRVGRLRQVVIEGRRKLEQVHAVVAYRSPQVEGQRRQAARSTRAVVDCEALRGALYGAAVAEQGASAQRCRTCAEGLAVDRQAAGSRPRRSRRRVVPARAPSARWRRRCRRSGSSRTRSRWSDLRWWAWRIIPGRVLGSRPASHRSRSQHCG